MTNYIFILLAVGCFAAQFAFTKLYEAQVSQTVATSLVMIAVSAACGVLLYLTIGGFRVEISRVSLFWAILFAAIMLPYYLIGIKVLSLGSLAIYSMFMMLGGMLVPFFYGVLWLHEAISWGKAVGSVFLTVFIVLQAVWQKPAQREKNDKKTKTLFFVSCLLIFFINGMTGVIAKQHQIAVGAVDEISFTVLSCGLTVLLSLLFLPICLLKDRQNVSSAVKNSLRPIPVLIMLLMGASAYTGNYLHLLAAEKVPASVQFPLVSGGVIVLSALVSAFVFRERLSAKEWVSVAGAFLSTVFFAF